MRQDEHLIAVVCNPSGGKDGHVINSCDQELFNLAVYYVWIFNKISRGPSLSAMTTAGLRALQPHLIIEKALLEVDVGEIPNYNGRNIPKMFEEIREYLTCLHGFTKIKIMYIIRKTLIPPLSAYNDETNYSYKDAEIIARSPILERDTISAADEAGLDLQATNGKWNSNALIYRRVLYVVMQTIFGTHHVW